VSASPSVRACSARTRQLAEKVSQSRRAKASP
jgi:hypothetical protein